MLFGIDMVALLSGTDNNHYVHTSVSLLKSHPVKSIYIILDKYLFLTEELHVANSVTYRKSQR